MNCRTPQITAVVGAASSDTIPACSSRGSLSEHRIRESLNKSIADLPASAHDAVISQMKRGKLVSNGDQIVASVDDKFSTIHAANGQLYQLQTPVEAAPNIDTVRWLRVGVKRVGFDVAMERPLNEIEVNKCLASAELSKRYSIKSALGSLKLKARLVLFSLDRAGARLFDKGGLATIISAPLRLRWSVISSRR
jgi:hypothetical protein